MRCIPQSIEQRPAELPEEAGQTDRVQVWPYLVRVEFVVSLAIMVILTVWSFALNALVGGSRQPNAHA